MELSEEDITEYQEIYKEQFGEEVSREEAYKQGINLLRLLEVVYKPSTKEEWEELRKRSEEKALLTSKRNRKQP